MFSENDNDFITIKESFKDDVKCTIQWLLSLLFADLYIYRINDFDISYSCDAEKIKSKYHISDIKDLVKKIETKRNAINKK